MMDPNLVAQGRTIWKDVKAQTVEAVTGVNEQARAFKLEPKDNQDELLIQKGGPGLAGGSSLRTAIRLTYRPETVDIGVEIKARPIEAVPLLKDRKVAFPGEIIDFVESLMFRLPAL